MAQAGLVLHCRARSGSMERLSGARGEDHFTTTESIREAA